MDVREKMSQKKTLPPGKSFIQSLNTTTQKANKMGEGKEVQGEHLPSELRSLTLSKKGKEDWCTRQAGRNCPI